MASSPGSREARMRYGVWTPLPHTIQPEPLMDAAIRESGRAGGADGPDKAFGFALDVIRRAEALGFETTLIAERWLGTDHPAWLLATALATLTSKIELMVAVHPGLIQPQVVAKFAASLDRISNGRAAINIVNGWWKSEFETYSAGPWLAEEDARYRRMAEYLAVLHGLWRDEAFTFAGEFYAMQDAILPLKCVRRPNPPIYAGSRNERGRDVVAQHGDCWFIDTLTDHSAWEVNIQRTRDLIVDMNARAGAHQRRLTYGMSCHVICAGAMDEALARARSLEEHGKTSRIAFVAAKALGPGLIGPPEEIARRIALYEDAGVGTLMIHCHPMLEGLERFAREVIPLVPDRRPCHGAKPRTSDGVDHNP